MLEALPLLMALNFTFQYRSDAEEMLLWLIDMEKLVENEDLGRDEASAQLLLKKHKVRGL